MNPQDSFYGDDGTDNIDPLTGRKRTAPGGSTIPVDTQIPATPPATPGVPPPSSPNTTVAKQWAAYGMTNSPDRSISDPPLPTVTTPDTKSGQLPHEAFGASTNNIGHDGTAANGMTREQWRDAWMSSGVKNKEQAQAWLAANGGQWVGDNGTITTPFGETGDLLIGARTGNGQPGWTFGGGGGSGGSGGGGVGSTTSGGPEYDALYEQLRKRAQQGIDVNRFDPNVRAQADANAANEERSRRDYLASAAEKSNPYGTGAMQGQERMTAESVGQRTGAFEAQLMAREVSARRDEIQNALTQMGSMLSEQQRLALQRELGYLNAELQRQQMAQQGSQFDQTLNFNSQDRKAYWDALNRGLLG